MNGTFDNSVTSKQNYYGQKFFTSNVTFLSLRTAGISKSSVISVDSCDFSLELKCSIFNWPAYRSIGSIPPSLSVSGTLIFAGSDSWTSCEQEILRIGLKINASTVWSMLGASWSSSLEKRQSHQRAELIKCAFDSQQRFPKWNKNIKKKELWEFSLRSRNCVFYFRWPVTLSKNKMTGQRLKILF